MILFNKRLGFSSHPAWDVWIEIWIATSDSGRKGGHIPFGMCGLKLSLRYTPLRRTGHIPFGGVWIEILDGKSNSPTIEVTSREGHVD